MQDDFPIKAKMAAVYWRMGCVVRSNVVLSEPTPSRKNIDVTDIDVLAVNVLPDFSSDITIVDCTTRAETIKHPIQRVLWLSGLMQLLGAHKGVLALGTDREIDDVPRVVAQRLGIALLNTTNTNEMVERYVKNGGPGYIPSPNDILAISELALQAGQSCTSIRDFMSRSYWIASPAQRLRGTISKVRPESKALDANQRPHRVLALEMLQLFSLALLSMARHAYGIGCKDPTPLLREFFFGGHDQVKLREDVLELAGKLAAFASKKTVDMFAAAPVLDPPYLAKLYEVVYRLLKQPMAAAQIPRLVEHTTLQHEIAGQPVDHVFSPLTKKLARDVADFYVEATALSPGLLQALYV
jgi:hypothetical protein